MLDGTIYDKTGSVVLTMPPRTASPVPVDCYLIDDKFIYYDTDSEKWRLLDSQGNTPYEERYYDCVHLYGLYFLVNGEGEWCIIDKHGDCIVDYGFISCDDHNLYYNGLEVEDVYVDDGIITLDMGGNLVSFIY